MFSEIGVVVLTCWDLFKLRSALALLQFHESVEEQYLHFRVFKFCEVRMK